MADKELSKTASQEQRRELIMGLIGDGKTVKEIQEQTKASTSTITKLRKTLAAANRSLASNTNGKVRNTSMREKDIERQLVETQEELQRRMPLMDDNCLIKYGQNLWDKYRALTMKEEKATNIQVNVSLSGVIEAASKTIDASQ